MIRVRVTEKVDSFGNRRIYNKDEELMVYCVDAILWNDHYMYRYKRDGRVYIDRIGKNCVEIVEEDI